MTECIAVIFLHVVTFVKDQCVM